MLGPTPKAPDKLAIKLAIRQIDTAVAENGKLTACLCYEKTAHDSAAMVSPLDVWL